ncbi:hypothetical protein D9613_006545 [Agrocybe pediades]|uniref:Uncharacterized protein n=1 Tax=Agrocybe pediades TaxID=84607 RepID=A0A8H4VK62_9AGAR|nr:hypothetical protein D9613_006545 [Agrocybe pediades]
MAPSLTLVTILTVFSRLSLSLSQSTTVIPMAFKWEAEQQVVVDIAGVQNGLTTYLIHDRPYDATFSADDGLGGTITYFLGETTASVDFIATDPNGGPAITANGACKLSGNKIGDSAICTTMILNEPDIGPQTTTETMTPATMTVGTINTAIPGQIPNGQGQSSSPAAGSPTPGSAGGSSSATPRTSPAGAAQQTASSSSNAAGSQSTQPSSASRLATGSSAVVALSIGALFSMGFFC